MPAPLLATLDQNAPWLEGKTDHQRRHIESVCRSLNNTTGKWFSRMFLPNLPYNRSLIVASTIGSRDVINKICDKFEEANGKYDFKQPRDFYSRFRERYHDEKKRLPTRDLHTQYKSSDLLRFYKIFQQQNPDIDFMTMEDFYQFYWYEYKYWFSRSVANGIKDTSENLMHNLKALSGGIKNLPFPKWDSTSIGSNVRSSIQDVSDAIKKLSMPTWISKEIGSNVVNNMRDISDGIKNFSIPKSTPKDIVATIAGIAIWSEALLAYTYSHKDSSQDYQYSSVNYSGNIDEIIKLVLGITDTDFLAQLKFPNGLTKDLHAFERETLLFLNALDADMNWEDLKGLLVPYIPVLKETIWIIPDKKLIELERKISNLYEITIDNLSQNLPDNDIWKVLLFWKEEEEINLETRITYQGDTYFVLKWVNWESDKIFVIDSEWNRKQIFIWENLTDTLFQTENMLEHDWNLFVSTRCNGEIILISLNNEKKYFEDRKFMKIVTTDVEIRDNNLFVKVFNRRFESSYEDISRWIPLDTSNNS